MRVREAEGHDVSPIAGIIGNQSEKTTDAGQQHSRAKRFKV